MHTKSLHSRVTANTAPDAIRNDKIAYRERISFMGDKKWMLLLGAALIFLSVVLYAIHYLIFLDSHHIGIYLLGDLAFLPVEVLLVTLIVHELLKERETRAKLEKLNMVIGSFFSSTGRQLLTCLSDMDPCLDGIRKNLIVTDKWTKKDFLAMKLRLTRYPCDIDISRVDLPALKMFLLQKEEFSIRLLENPVLLEHEKFTGLLRAVFHLTEELAERKDLSALPDNDRAHLSTDIGRVYRILVIEQLDYMVIPWQLNYPYLFSPAMRTNPFDETANAIIQ